MPTTADLPELPRALRQPLTTSVELLLASRLPARLGWTDPNGHPQMAPMWFEWLDGEILLSAFAGARKLDHLADGDRVVVSIDTSEFPYRALRVWGPITLESVDGLTASYRRSAERYLGTEAAVRWCARLDGANQVLIRLRPDRASASDLSTSGFYAAGPGADS
ncbi:MAG: pyridoxamine 5'-phosphate oxidase family protein [Actinomycetota bacterium]